MAFKAVAVNCHPVAGLANNSLTCIQIRLKSLFFMHFYHDVKVVATDKLSVYSTFSADS